ncbi:phosphotransferase [Streptomyces sp. NBC_01620]|uniref:phosphotransferase n=1 Tax=Streptomyces sp. NBC_01620 TaxID=2975902 RepID=UPI00386B73E5|nr:phosphotransferase [Streptomyces sp. NBC_01620]
MEGDWTHWLPLRESGAQTDPVYARDPCLPGGRSSPRSRQCPAAARQFRGAARPDPDRRGRQESPARRRTAHRQAGQLLRRFHDAMTGPLVQPEADTVVENTVAGLDKHLAKAGDHLSTTEAELLRHLVGALPGCGPLPAGWLHGDFWERNLLWNGQRCTLIDFERSEPGPRVADFVKLATSLWLDHPELRTALFEGYGRPLSEAEEYALTAFAAADAASALAYGPRHGDPLVTARGRRTVAHLLQEGRL